MTFEQIAWLPVCAGLTVAGLALSYLVFRRRGAVAAVRVLAWSLLPSAAYLTGALRTLWTIGAGLVSFVTGLVFSPAVWAGVSLAGLSALLFLVSGALRGRALTRARRAAAQSGSPAASSDGRAAASSGSGTAVRPSQPRAVQPSANDGDDFADIEAILQRRGIT